MDEFHVTKSVCITDLRRAVNFGFFRKENPQENNSHYTYVVRKGPYEDVRCSGLTQTQRELLSKLYAGFKNLEFTVKEGARKIRCKESTLDFHLINFTERGIVSIIKHPEYPGHAQAYSFAVTPKDHPTCFQSDPHVRPFYPHSGSSYQPEPVPLAAASG